jgi:hypothetical protein
MPSYDAESFAPPAPIARVMLCNLERTATAQGVPMLLDTGADVSLVPRAATERLNLSAEPAGRVQRLGFDGRPTVADAYDLELVFLERVFRGRFLVTEEACGILGRNILNALPILYDGPRLTWDLR